MMKSVVVLKMCRSGRGGRDARGRGDGDRRTDDVTRWRRRSSPGRRCCPPPGTGRRGLRDAHGFWRVRGRWWGRGRGRLETSVGLLVGVARHRLEEILVDELATDRPWVSPAVTSRRKWFPLQTTLFSASAAAAEKLGNACVSPFTSSDVRLTPMLSVPKKLASVAAAAPADAAMRGDPRGVVRRVVQRQPGRVCGRVGVAVLVGRAGWR